MNIGKQSTAGVGFPRPLAGRGLFALLLAACLIAGALPCTRAEADGVRRVTVRYHVWEDSPEKSYEVDFDDSVFFSDPGVYSHALCRMSLGMALSAFRPTDKDGDQSGNIRSFLDGAACSPYIHHTPAGISEIVFEEVSAYLGGGADADRCVRNIQSRVGIWLAEHR